MSTTQVSPNLDSKVMVSTENVEPLKKSKATVSDKAMFRCMIMLLTSIGRSEETGASLSDLSKTLYDTMIANGVKKVEELQDELEFLNAFLDGFENCQAYISWEEEISYLKNEIAKMEAEGRTTGIWEGVYQDLKFQLGEKEPNPPLIPEKLKEDKAKLIELAKTYTKKSGARDYVNGVLQQLSTENHLVSSNKQLPDGLQTQVKTMVLEQGVLVGQMMSVIRIIQRQLQH